MNTDIRTVDEVLDGGLLKHAARSNGPRSVERVTETLQQIARCEAGYSLAELARRLNVPKASLADILAGLVACDFLTKGQSGRYVLGAAAVAFARMAVSSNSFSDLTHHHLEALVEKINETALIARLDYESMVSVYVDKVESNQAVRYTVPLGLRRELYATSAGKVLLAYMPKSDQSAYLRSVPFERFTPRTIVDRRTMERELEQVLADGFASTNGERSVGASGISAPILDRDGQLLGAITVAGPSARIQPVRDEIISHVGETAQRICTVFRQIYNA